ncbi:hypothetical protein V8E53_015860 [Lactarius tabidus]
MPVALSFSPVSPPLQVICVLATLAPTTTTTMPTPTVTTRLQGNILELATYNGLHPITLVMQQATTPQYVTSLWPPCHHATLLHLSCCLRTPYHLSAQAPLPHMPCCTLSPSTQPEWVQEQAIICARFVYCQGITTATHSTCQSNSTGAAAGEQEGAPKLMTMGQWQQQQQRQ